LNVSAFLSFRFARSFAACRIASAKQSYKISIHQLRIVVRLPEHNIKSKTMLNIFSPEINA
jgi:hypothetical protein